MDISCGKNKLATDTRSRICSLHFNSDDYYQSPSNRLFLKSGVFPQKYVVLSDNKENDDLFKVLNDKLRK